MGVCNGKEKFRKINIKKQNNEKFELKKVGFSNIGNSCYMNSFLQILLHCPNFLYELQDFYNRSKLGECLIKNIIDLSNSEYPYNTQYLYSIKKYMKDISDYGTSNQNDSQDFGKDLINEISINIKPQKDFTSSLCLTEREIIDKKKKKYKFKKYLEKYQRDENFVETMFTINECQSIFEGKIITNIIFNSSVDIQLNFPKNSYNEYNENYSLKNLLDLNYYNKNKNFSTINKEKNYKIIKTNLTKLCKLPKILIISLMRSLINQKLITSFLSFPEILDLEKYIDKDLVDNPINTKYELFAINNCKGNENSKGHYYCQIKIKNNWFSFSDENVNKTKIKLSSKNVVELFNKYKNE